VHELHKQQYFYNSLHIRRRVQRWIPHWFRRIDRNDRNPIRSACEDLGHWVASRRSQNQIDSDCDRFAKSTQKNGHRKSANDQTETDNIPAIVKEADDYGVRSLEKGTRWYVGVYPFQVSMFALVRTIAHGVLSLDGECRCRAARLSEMVGGGGFARSQSGKLIYSESVPKNSTAGNANAPPR
jgi:hypothetical protein